MSRNEITLLITALFFFGSLLDVFAGNPEEKTKESAYVLPSEASGRVPREIRSWKTSKFSVDSLAFRPDGRVLAVGSSDCKVRTWNVATGKAIRIFGDGISWRSARKFWKILCRGIVAFSPDGKILASEGGDNTIKLWDFKSGSEIASLGRHKAFVGSLAFSPDGKILASGTWYATIRLWDVASAREIGRLAWEGKKSASFDRVRLMPFSPDARLDAVLGDPLTADPVMLVAFSPDGKVLASARLEDKQIWLWDVASRRMIRKLVGHRSLVYGLAFSPDGRILASASGDRTVKLWDVASGKEIRTLLGHTRGVHGVTFYPGGKVIASASGDRTVRFWDVGSGKEIVQQSGLRHVFCLAFSPDGKLLATGSWEGVVTLWDISPGEQ